MDVNRHSSGDKWVGKRILSHQTQQQEKSNSDRDHGRSSLLSVEGSSKDYRNSSYNYKGGMRNSTNSHNPNHASGLGSAEHRLNGDGGDGLTHNLKGNHSNNIRNRRHYSHRLSDEEPVLPPPRSVQLRNSMQSHCTSSYIPSPRHSVQKSNFNDFQSSSSHAYTRHWAFSNTSSSNRANNTSIRQGSVDQSAASGNSHSEGIADVMTTSPISFFIQGMRKSGDDASKSASHFSKSDGSCALNNNILPMKNSFQCESFSLLTGSTRKLPPTHDQIFPLPQSNTADADHLPLPNTFCRNTVDASLSQMTCDRHCAAQTTPQPPLPLDASGHRNNTSLGFARMLRQMTVPETECKNVSTGTCNIDEAAPQQEGLALVDWDDSRGENCCGETLGIDSNYIARVSSGSGKWGIVACDTTPPLTFNVLSGLTDFSAFFSTEVGPQSPKPASPNKASDVPVTSMMAAPNNSVAAFLFLQLTGEGIAAEESQRSSSYPSYITTMHDDMKRHALQNKTHNSDSNVYDNIQTTHDVETRPNFCDLFSELTQSEVTAAEEENPKAVEAAFALVTTACSDKGSHSAWPSLPQMECAVDLVDTDSKKLSITGAEDAMGGRGGALPQFDKVPLNQVCLQTVTSPSHDATLLESSHNAFLSTNLASTFTESVTPLTSGRFSQLHSSNVLRSLRSLAEIPVVTRDSLVCIFRGTPPSVRCRERTQESRQRETALVHSMAWPPKTEAEVERLLKQHNAFKLLRHLTIINFSRQHIKGVQELFDSWIRNGIPAPDMGFGAYYYYVKELSEKMLCMKHNGRGAIPGHGYGKCDFETRRPNSTCRYEHVCLFCRSREHGWFEEGCCEGYQQLLAEVEELGVLEEDVRVMLDAMEKNFTWAH